MWYSDWSKCYIHPARAWILSSPSLLSRQWNMADSCWWSFPLFKRHHLKSRIFGRVENFINDCCCLSTKIFQELLFKLKLLIFRWWWQLWMKETMIKQRYQMKLLFIVFRLFVLPNLTSKLIENQAHESFSLKLQLHTYTYALSWTIMSVF